MQKTTGFIVLVILASAGAAEAVPIPSLTIPDVQFSDAANGWTSFYANQIVDVTGGVVTYAATPPGKSTPRVIIQDPGFSEWAGIEIKVFDGTLADGLQIGDRVDLTDVYVDESSKARGTTYLLFDVMNYGSSFTVVSGGHTVDPTVIDLSILGAGDESADPVQAEKYEGMLLSVADVTVTAMDLGSHSDNYELTNTAGACWASDYLNVDRQAVEDYHAKVGLGAGFDAIVGVLEQYTKTSNDYDYYQLLTRSGADFVPEPASVVLLLLGSAAMLGRKKRT
ncbi:MAG: PEP-CTERM sorting domain-containing protein [Planctomycetota bacterium]|nr:PEP-CTERM sorting domain-containing protein [Planctomycetota bacterium]